jgi:putative membrane protein
VRAEAGVTPLQCLPHVNGGLNGVIAALLLAALAAIRAGRRALHARLMGAAVVTGVLFLVLYVLQSVLLPHRRFPGHDWVRAAFVVILGSHELLAVAAVPLIARTVYLARKGRLDEHRRIVRFTFPVWLYVALTGLVIYAMNNHVRPR